MAAYFKLVLGSSYNLRSKETGKLYIFHNADVVVRVAEPIDIEKFRMMRDRFGETDEHGTMLPQSGSGALMGFTRKGMKPPKSYVKIGNAKAPSAAPSTPEPTPPSVETRTISSSKKTDGDGGDKAPDKAPDKIFDRADKAPDKIDKKDDSEKLDKKASKISGGKKVAKKKAKKSGRGK